MTVGTHWQSKALFNCKFSKFLSNEIDVSLLFRASRRYTSLGEGQYPYQSLGLEGTSGIRSCLLPATKQYLNTTVSGVGVGNQQNCRSYPILSGIQMVQQRLFCGVPCRGGMKYVSPRLRVALNAGGTDGRRHVSGTTTGNIESTVVSATSRSKSSEKRPKYDLLEIKGIGPVNANLLVSKSITSVDRLQEIYHLTCNQDPEELQEFLHNVVGFRNPAHSRSVADYLKNLEWEPKPSRVKLAVEGNIGAGKSTFLDVLCDGTLELQDIIEIVPEPVEEWQRVRTGDEAPVNLLDQFYKDPKRYAYTFQHYVLLTRMQKDRNARSSNKPLQILERSIFSDRMVFVRAMHEAGFLGDLELSIYDSWFSMQIGQDRALTPDGFIYLKARPETCIKRLRNRNRSEEAGVDEAYLENLHDKHESWLHFGARQLNDYIRADDRQKVLQTVSALKRMEAGLSVSPQLNASSPDGLTLSMDLPEVQMMGEVPELIRDSVVFLGNGLPGDVSIGEGAVGAALSGVPALVLDHEQEDILYDNDARKDYANKVMAFSDYVNKVRATRSRIDVENSMPLDEAEKLRGLMDEYRKLRERHRRDTSVLEGNLAEIETTLRRLAAGDLNTGFGHTDLLKALSR